MEEQRGRILAVWQDKRLAPICHALVAAGYEVMIAGCTLPRGMPEDVRLVPNYRGLLSEVDAVLLPLPTLRAGGLIAFAEEEIPYTELLSGMKRGATVLAGMIPEERIREAEAMGLRAYDYYESEDVKRRNACLTAEGAIAIAMQELPVALYEARAAVVGCGRIGNALTRMLRAMNVDVTALARRRESLLDAEIFGARTALLTEESLKRTVSEGFDVVFTTVPFRLFGREELSLDRPLTGGRRTLYIDLSSSPGSFDPAAARDCGVRLLWALSLPGKYAPDSAGRVLSRRIIGLLSGEERAL